MILGALPVRVCKMSTCLSVKEKCVCTVLCVCVCVCMCAYVCVCEREREREKERERESVQQLMHMSLRLNNSSKLEDILIKKSGIMFSISN